MKDSKQGELIEEESRLVESQILPPAVPLFILKDEAQRIRAAGLKEESTTPNNSLAVEIRAIQAHGTVVFTEVGGRSGGRCRIVERRPHALHHPL